VGIGAMMCVVVTISRPQLFGQKLTFLMSLEGHEFFFQQPEEDFDAVW
jgi:hypothetical protein